MAPKVKMLEAHLRQVSELPERFFYTIQSNLHEKYVAILFMVAWKMDAFGPWRK